MNNHNKKWNQTSCNIDINYNVPKQFYADYACKSKKQSSCDCLFKITDYVLPHLGKIL